MSKIKISLFSICLASACFASPAGGNGNNVTLGSGLYQALTGNKGIAFSDSMGPLKYQCKVDFNKFNSGGFDISKIITQKIEKYLNDKDLSLNIGGGIFSCQVGINAEQALCANKIVNKLEKLVSKGENEIKKGEEWLKSKVIAFGDEKFDKAAYGYAEVKNTLGNYCNVFNDGNDSEFGKMMEAKKTEKKIKNAMYQIENKLFGVKNSGGKALFRQLANDEEFVKAIGIEDGEVDLEKIEQTIKEQYNPDIMLQKLSSDKIAEEQTAKIATATKSSGLLDDPRRKNIELQFADLSAKWATVAREACKTKEASLEYEACVQAVMIDEEKKCFTQEGKDCLKITKDAKDLREQEQRLFYQTLREANANEQVYSAEEIQNMAMSVDDRAYHVAKLLKHMAKETLQEIKMNKQIQLTDELSRLQIEHALASSKGFDLEMALESTRKIIEKSEEHAKCVTYCIIGTGDSCECNNNRSPIPSSPGN